MNPLTESPTIRPAHNDDIDGMRMLLNEIIRVGGTTAITTNSRQTKCAGGSSPVRT